MSAAPKRPATEPAASPVRIKALFSADDAAADVRTVGVVVSTPICDIPIGARFSGAQRRVVYSLWAVAAEAFRQFVPPPEDPVSKKGD